MGRIFSGRGGFVIEILGLVYCICCFVSEKVIGIVGSICKLNIWGGKYYWIICGWL